MHTAHFQTSRKADAKNIKGSIEEGKNEFHYSDQYTVKVEKKNDTYYQTEYVNGIAKVAQPIDITVGSGKRGQTFLYWNDGYLMQLPLTYFTSLDQWTNSPGYSNRITFKRPITTRCLECHSTYFQSLSSINAFPEKFSTQNIIYGVSCEKCHGPAAEHVAFHTKNPQEKKGKFIINPATFSRVQSLEMCRLCHGGRLSKTEPSFSFKAGDKLSNYFKMDSAITNLADMDVHGNQYGMLAASKCFKMSEMTCNSCHSAHENETGKTELYSQRCKNCHSTNGYACTVKGISEIKNNCIDCHMPEQPSKAIMVLLQGNNVPVSASMRSHFIRIDKEATHKFLVTRKNKG
ncbi:MAG: hypothetical protein KGO81_03635 [Bacteroidota bacterium]|nr:hypothetical protein [Bacteroidota bacterium]